MGYATVNGNTTGGEGGTSVTVTTGTELQDAINNKGNQPLTIYIDGVITPQNSAGLSKIDLKDVDDISVLGLGHGAEFNGIGIKIWRASNIILRNLRIHHVDIGNKDCISVEGPADHIWVDHCELYNEYQSVGKDDYDGLFDIKRSTDYVTFSWNYLHDSWKCSLSGSSESDTFNRQVSYHHNIYENANSRLPLFRGGTGHIFNNYYVDVVSTAINSRINACIRIENNHFQNVQNPWVSAYSDILGAVDTIGNVRINSPFDYSSSDTHQPLSCSLTPPYSYTDQLLMQTTFRRF
ncbi:MAG: pectate lyase [Bacteroidia bacterium]